MKKTLEFLFLAFCTLFIVFGIKFLVSNLQPDPIASEIDRETQAIQKRMDAINISQAAKPTEPNNSYCQKVASELASTGQLADLSRNPSCVNWAVPITYSEQNKLAATSLQSSNQEQAAQDFNRQMNMVVAFYIDQETALRRDYNRVKGRRSDDLISGRITEGQHSYFLSKDEISHLEKMLDNKRQLVSAMYAEINKRVDVSALYAKYNLPVDTGAATLKAISSQASNPVEKSIFLALSEAKSK